MAYERWCFLLDYLKVLNLQSKRKYHEAISIVMKRLKRLRNESILHDIKYKMLFYNSYIELLLILNHQIWARNFMERDEIKTKPLHLKSRILSISNHLSIRESLDTLYIPIKEVNVEGKDKLITYYQSIHQYYYTGNHRKTLDLINEYIRKFAVSSVQQVDLMILEMICHFELKKFDLLDYKLQSFLKNLAYRSKFNVPNYYHSIYKVFQSLLRYKNRRDMPAIILFINQLRTDPVSGLMNFRSFQPILFLKWSEKKCEDLERDKIKEEDEPEFSVSAQYQVA